MFCFTRGCCNATLAIIQHVNIYVYIYISIFTSVEAECLYYKRILEAKDQQGVFIMIEY